MKMTPSGNSIAPATASRIAWPSLELPGNPAPAFAQGMSPAESAALSEYHLTLKNVLDQQFNTQLRTGAIPGIAGYRDDCLLFESSFNSGLWSVNGSTNAITGDGVHPSTPGWIAWASSFASFFTVSPTIPVGGGISTGTNFGIFTGNGGGLTNLNGAGLSVANATNLLTGAKVGVLTITNTIAATKFIGSNSYTILSTDPGIIICNGSNQPVTLANATGTAGQMWSLINTNFNGSAYFTNTTWADTNAAGYNLAQATNGAKTTVIFDGATWR